MESNITKILIKKFWKRCVTLTWGMVLPFWCSLSLMTLPSEAPALLPTQEKTYLPLKSSLRTSANKEQTPLPPASSHGLWEEVTFLAAVWFPSDFCSGYFLAVFVNAPTKPCRTPALLGAEATIYVALWDIRAYQSICWGLGTKLFAFRFSWR